MTQASTNKHNFFAVTNLQHFLSAVYNTSEYKLNRGAHKEFTTQIYKPKPVQISTIFLLSPIYNTFSQQFTTQANIN